jgi:mutator protein MutT
MSSSEPTPIAVAVVQDSGRVLIGRRRPEGPLAGYWEFPGGKVGPGETPNQAAARECREETGLDVHVGKLHLELVYPYEHGPVQLYFFAAAAADPTQAPAQPFQWVPLSDLDQYAFPPANAAVLDLLAQKARQAGGR